jgi:hypothetical protein
MTEKEVKFRLQALKLYDVHINILKEQVIKNEKEIAIRKKQGLYYDLQEMHRDFALRRMQEVKQNKESTLRFVKMYADSEDDAELLLKHFFEGKTYLQMAEELYYSERNVTRIVTNAVKRIVENAKDADAKDFPY